MSSHTATVAACLAFAINAETAHSDAAHKAWLQASRAAQQATRLTVSVTQKPSVRSHASASRLEDAWTSLIPSTVTTNDKLEVVLLKIVTENRNNTMEIAITRFKTRETAEPQFEKGFATAILQSVGTSMELAETKTYSPLPIQPASSAARLEAIRTLLCITADPSQIELYCRCINAALPGEGFSPQTSEAPDDATFETQNAGIRMLTQETALDARGGSRYENLCGIETWGGNLLIQLGPDFQTV